MSWIHVGVMIVIDCKDSLDIAIYMNWPVLLEIHEIWAQCMMLLRGDKLLYPALGLDHDVCGGAFLSALIPDLIPAEI
jgi:hypothetical protein